jgi:hypothetical protein
LSLTAGWNATESCSQENNHAIKDFQAGTDQGHVHARLKLSVADSKYPRTHMFDLSFRLQADPFTKG